MTQQIALFTTEQKNKVIIHVPPGILSISPYNPRKSRAVEYVTSLAERIERNGYEITRAMWAYKNGKGYEVFAGGTRLQAALQTKLSTVPILLHTGYTDEEIVLLADQDNENDEYHEPVSIVDTWASYKALADLGWTQERIAEAKGCKRQQAGWRIQYAELPSSILGHFAKNDFLKESYAAEIVKLQKFCNLSPWLTRETAMLHVIAQSLRKPIAATFKTEVNKLNKAITLVKSAMERLPSDRLLQRLADSTARTVYDAQVEIDKLTVIIAAEKKKEADEAQRVADGKEAERIEAEAQKAKAEHRLLIESLDIGQWWKLGQHFLYCGDTAQLEFYDKLPDAPLAFADPPYNANNAEWDNGFCWAHDWLSDKADIVAVTPGIASIFDFAKTTTMPYRWAIACWIKNGMTRGALGFGNWIYTALFSKAESIHRQKQDFFSVTIATSETNETAHKGRKPSAYMEKIIGLFSESGDWILDPFAGSGSTLFACEKKKRRCICGEIEPAFCKEIIRRWESQTSKKAKKNETNTIQQ